MTTWPLPIHPEKYHEGRKDQLDFLKRLGISEALKVEMRRRYALAVRQSAGESSEKFLSRSREFWGSYEGINLTWTPEDPVYSGTRSGVTLATNADLWSYGSPAAGQARVLESFIGGEATVSTVLRLAVQRSTIGIAPTLQTPEKFNTRSPASSGSFATGWGTQPSLSGNAALFHAFNAFGGTDRWVPQPGEEMYMVNAEYLSGRSASGTPVVSSHLVWEEL